MTSYSPEEFREEAETLSESQLEHLRLRACNSLFFMANGVLGYKDVNPDTHGDFCKFLEDDSIDRKLELMPRGTLKTTIATEADSIRRGFKDPEGARILIANEIFDNAVAIQRTIRQQCEKNPVLRMLFGHLIPARFQGAGVQWSDSGASLIRTSAWKEATWSPLGVGGAAVSKHFSHIKGDDLIGYEAYRSPAAMKWAVEWVDQLEGITIPGETIIDFTGTRWARKDLYAHIMRRYGNRLKVFSRSLEEVDENGETYIIYPKGFSPAYVALLKKKPHIYHAQYLNNPLSDAATDFSEHNLRYFRFRSDGAIVAGSYVWPREALDRVLTCDPNSGSLTAPDEAAICVSGVAPTRDVFALESWGGRVSPDAFIDKIILLAKKWRVRIIGVEKAGQQNTEFYLKKKMREIGWYCNVVPLKPGNKDKETRIREALDGIISEQRLWLLKESQSELIQQIKDFPDLENDDRIDCLAYGPQLWRAPLAIEQQRKNRSAVELLLANRNRRTGY